MTMERLEPGEREELIDLTKDLIGIPSSVKDGNEIYGFVKERLEEHGIPVRFQDTENPHIEYQDYSNLITELGNGEGPKIMINCHLDSVMVSGGWNSDPYDAREEGDRIYGLGSADMKAGCAAAIYSVIALMVRKEEIDGTLCLTCVWGEEAPFSLGTDTLLDQYDFDDYDLIIVTEPSPLLAIEDYCVVHKDIHAKPEFPVLIVGAQGRVMLEIEVFGKSSHASHPSQGINALYDAARIIAKLEEFDVPVNVDMGKGHYTVLNLEGGDDSFTVPDHVRLLVNRRLVLDETPRQVIEEVEGIMDGLDLGSELKIGKRYSPAEHVEYRPYLNRSSEYIDRLLDRFPVEEGRDVCRFSTSSVGDFNLFGTRTDAPTVVFGPGGGEIHSPNEYVSKEETIETAEYLLDFLLEIF